jgi:hypothetical protein
LNKTLSPVPDGVGLKRTTAPAELAANERRIPAKIPVKIFIGRCP